ncbi:MAG: hypothetical protein ABI353_01230 [Isosphaeraceae bacterium]
MSGAPGTAPSSGKGDSDDEPGTAAPGDNGLVVAPGVRGRVGIADLGLNDEPGLPVPLDPPGSGIVNVPLREGLPVNGDCAVETVARPSTRTAQRPRGVTFRGRLHLSLWIDTPQSH